LENEVKQFGRILSVVIALSVFFPLTSLAQTKGKVLIVVSSEHELVLKNGKIYQTGYYLNELAVPAKALSDAGYELVFANPKGNAPSMDVTSDNAKYFGGDQQKYLAMKAFHDSLKNLQSPMALKDVISGGLSEYKAIFIPGGHAPMTDLMASPELGQILTHFHVENKPTAIICHGPCALVSTVKDPVAYRQALVAGDFAKAQTLASDWIYKGYSMTVFSTTEDILGIAKMGGELPFYPETVLQSAGAKVEVGEQRKSNTRMDRELITGQNPQSDEALCTALLAKL
jgi:putative intracellular protease/amidase